MQKQVFGASYVATTASPGRKTELCTRLGADRVVNYRSDKFWEVRQSQPASRENETEIRNLQSSCTVRTCPSVRRAAALLPAQVLPNDFDACLDMTKEAGKCLKIAKPGEGHVCSIVGAPTSEMLQKWVREMGAPLGAVSYACVGLEALARSAVKPHL